MHNNISSEEVGKLDRLAYQQGWEFGKLFHKLSPDHQNEYIEHVKEKQSLTAMYSVLSMVKRERAFSIFKELLENKEEFAFNTLGYAARKPALFKDLFDKLDQREDKYIEHAKEKPEGLTAMYSVLSVVKRERAFSIFKELLEKEEGFAFDVLNRATQRATLFKDLFDKLDQREDEYIEHVKENLKDFAMYNILNVIKRERACSIFEELLEKEEGFAFDVLNRATQRATLFKDLFDKLDQREDEYIEHVKENLKDFAMYNILNVIKRERACSIFEELLEKDKEFAFNILDCAVQRVNLFKDLFDKLDQRKDEYIERVKENLKYSVMCGILDMIKCERACSIFKELPQKGEEVCFQYTRLCCAPSCFFI
ncbi:hypothetical protein [Wolbachia endosymbiont of Aedes albopictus]|uniref:hypothetical protein n=1 Tax=Wolbachia endosymbiont of Aedes albopictus TaxID=167957 RepID=UPI000BBCDB2B|nr:hypothetical protein [Wolbachia endosymbiont of Aedes albopictus]UVW83964.1 hypothetical protein NHG98_00335 [Wolbachia endosymbiont of Aedes albopictus]